MARQKATRRDAMGFGLAALNRLAGSPLLDRTGLRKPVENVVATATRQGFRVAGAAQRTFKATTRLGKPARLAPTSETGLFDLTPTDEQQMIVETGREFAAEQLRPAAAEADDTRTLARRTAQALGRTRPDVGRGPRGTRRDSAPNAPRSPDVLVAEALAHGDMGLAVAVLAPAAVSNVLVSWGDAHAAGDLPARVRRRRRARRRRWRCSSARRCSTRSP